MKISISSTRVYYRDLLPEDREIILHDISLYQSIRNHAYNILYNNFQSDANIPLSSTLLKEEYGINDYIPLSAIAEAKGLLRSNITWNKKTIDNMIHKAEKIEKKIKKEQDKLDRYYRCLDSLISCSKTGKPEIVKIPDMKWRKKEPDICTFRGVSMNLYLFEVNIVKPGIKRIKHRIRLLEERSRNLRFKTEKRMNTMPRSRFTNNRYIRITGRSQGKYCNNLFKYDYTQKVMIYTSSDKTKISFQLVFPYRGKELIRVLKMPHSTPGKSVCYTLTDHGEYFIISAAVTLPDKDIPFDRTDGVVGMDINADHVALSSTDRYGNMLWCRSIRYELSHKTRNQRIKIIEDVARQVCAICKAENKPLVKEDLDFSKAKKEMEMYNSNRRYNRMLSELCYRMIDEKIEARAYKDNVAVARVNPAYTSRIGDMKYRREKGISVHHSAAYVIARRGMGYRERVYGY